MHCDKRTQWMKDGRDEGWLNPAMGLCSNLQDANWNDIDLPPYSAGLRNCNEHNLVEAPSQLTCKALIHVPQVIL